MKNLKEIMHKEVPIAIVIGLFLAWYVRIFIHESGHAIIAWITGAKNIEIVIGLEYGITYMTYYNVLEGIDKAALYLAGPVITIFAAIVLLYLSKKVEWPWKQTFKACSIIYVICSIRDLIPSVPFSKLRHETMTDGYYLEEVWGFEIQMMIVAITVVLLIIMILRCFEYPKRWKIKEIGKFLKR